MKMFFRSIFHVAVATILLGLNLAADADESKRLDVIDVTNIAIAPLKFAEVTPRQTDTVEAEQALDQWGLLRPRKNGWTWGERTGQNGNYIFTRLAMTTKTGGEFTIGKLALSGVRMDGDIANFDQAVIHDLDMQGIEPSQKSKLRKDSNKREIDWDTDRIQARKLVLTYPSANFANGIFAAFSGDMETYEKMAVIPEYGHQAAYDIVISSSKNTRGIKIDHWILGQDIRGEGGMSLAGVKTYGGFDSNTSLSLASIDIRGVNLKKLKPIFAVIAEEASLEQKRAQEQIKKKSKAKNKKNDDLTEAQSRAVLAFMNPYIPNYSHISLRDLRTQSDGFQMFLSRIDAVTRLRDGKIYSNLTTSPLTIMDTPGANDKGKTQLSLQELGFDKIELSLGHEAVMDPALDRIHIKNSYIEMKDGFKLSYNFDGIGLMDFMEEAVMSSIDTQELSDKQMLALITGLGRFKTQITFEDRSILDFGFELAAQSQNKDKADLKKQASALMTLLPMFVEQKELRPIVTEFGTAVQKLIESGGTLVIATNWDLPLTQARAKKLLKDDMASMEFFGLSAVHVAK